MDLFDFRDCTYRDPVRRLLGGRYGHHNFSDHHNYSVAARAHFYRARHSIVPAGKLIRLVSSRESGDVSFTMDFLR